MLDSLPEVSMFLSKEKWAYRYQIISASSASKLTKFHVAGLERAVEICESATGPTSNFTGASILLVCKASAASGQFKKGKRYLSKLQTSFDIPVDLNRLDFLAGGDVSQSPPSDQEEGIVVSEEDAVVFAKTSPFEAVEYARQLLFQFRHGSAEPKVLSVALSLLDSVSFDDLPIQSSLYQSIALNAHVQVALYQTQALLGMTLGHLAHQLHIKDGKAVSSEGLFRAAIDKLEPLATNEECFLRNVVGAERKFIAENYALLLDSWENREADAAAVRSSMPASQSCDLTVNISAWDRNL